MKPHLPLPLRRALLRCTVSVAFALACGSYAAFADADTPLTLSRNESDINVLFVPDNGLLIGDTELVALETSDAENIVLSTTFSSDLSTVSYTTDTSESNSPFAGTSLFSSAGLLLAGTENYTNGTYEYSKQTGHLADMQDFKNYKGVLFNENTTSTAGSDTYHIVCGGAIYAYSTLNFIDNSDITFSKNTATESSLYGVEGGAIYASTLNFSGNGAITFSGNTASTAGRAPDLGGAIYARTALTFSSNGDITFSGNTVSTTAAGSLVRGGAIDAYTLTFIDNGDISFSGNSASSSTFVTGGAIYASRTLTFTGNVSITFSGNTASSSSSHADGGAIWASTLAFTDNGDIIFSGNTVSTTGSGNFSYVCGGAIYAGSSSTLTIQGSALFEKNTEITSGTYQLRSIYQSSGSLELSAPTDRSIEFRDSIYSEAGTVIFNRDYEKSDGTTQAADGTILFTGKYTAADLAEMKGSDGKAAELKNSRTSEITGTVQLKGGTLSVEDGAILNTGGVTMADGSTLALQDATLAATGKAITMAEGASITTQGSSTLSFGTLMLTQAIANSGTLTLSGSINADALHFSNLADVDGQLGTSGFLNNGATLQIVDGGSAVIDGVTVTHASMSSGAVLTLDSDGVATMSGGADYSTYMLTGADCVSVSAIRAISGAEDATITQTGGELTADADVCVASTGGEIILMRGTLSGSVGGAGRITKAGNETAAMVSANSYTGGTVIESGTLTVSHADALGSGTVEVQGGSLVVADGVTLNVSSLAFGSAEDARGTMTASAASGFTLGAGVVGYDSNTDTAMLSGTDDEALVLDNVLVDMAAGSTLKLENVVLAASAQLTDDTATLQADGLTVQVEVSNAVLSAPRTMTATSLTVSGHAPHAAGDAPLWPTTGSTVRTLTLKNISNYTITGSSLFFDLSSYSALADATSENYVGIVFETATMDLSNLTVTATMNGKDYTAYYDSTQPNGTAYFDLTAATVPEPATTALSLLALAGVAARRRRK